jgi:homoserine O-succinyltransferase/O-acetyltransferase
VPFSDLASPPSSAAVPAKSAPPCRGAREPLVVGLVNNMPDAALHSTESQFRRLVAAAGDGLAVRFRLFYLPEVPRTERGRSYLEQHYEAADRLWRSPLDGLIVTGTEPRAPDLRDEPYWPALARLVDWAEEHTISTVWSCLAAHAAVLHEDGIVRRMLPAKLSGVFQCRRIADHPLVEGTPQCWRVAHSRCNELPETSLRSRGYRLLSRSAEAGADLFIRQRESLFIYFQGHPEYDADSLAREYRRDVGRFLAGERDDYPATPRGYFDAAAAAALAALRERALRERSPDLIADYPAEALAGGPHVSSRLAATIYRRWLSFLAAGGHGLGARVPLEPRQAETAAMLPHRGG